METPNATKVSTGKASVTGAVFRAPQGTTLPTNASSAIADPFVCLGYVSEDGLTNTNSPESDNIKAWGGDVVIAMQNGKPDTFKFKLIESMNQDVQKAVYGSANVTTITVGEGDDSHTETKITANASDQEDASWIFEIILKGSKIKRIVVPNAKITEIGDIGYSDSDAIGYEVTITAVPDANGNTHYEYIY